MFEIRLNREIKLCDLSAFYVVVDGAQGDLKCVIPWREVGIYRFAAGGVLPFVEAFKARMKGDLIAGVEERGRVVDP